MAKGASSGEDRAATASQPSRTVSGIAGIPSADIVCGDDGFFVYWPTGNQGAYSSHMLREIADCLDQKNLPWAERIQIEFCDPYRPSPEARRIAQKIVNSDRTLSVFAASEWDELHPDGQNWIAAIVAQAIEDRRVETQGGSVHENAAPAGCAHD